MFRYVFLALLLSSTVPAFAQTNASRVLGAGSEETGDGPLAFLACCNGSWWLNGTAGIVLHYHDGIVEHWALAQDNATPDWYYYHEKSLDGTVDFPNYQWRFYRHFDPAHPMVGVYRKYPGDNNQWVYVCTACLNLPPKDALATTESRSAAAKKAIE
jgi:hypothetical protein